VQSRAGIAFGLAAVAWFVVFGVAMATWMNSIGLVGRERPAWLVWLVATAPAFYWFFARLLGRRRGFRWMLVSPQPEARLDHEGLELMLSATERGNWSWDDVGELEAVTTAPGRIREVLDSGVTPNGRLVDPNGRILSVVPRALLLKGDGRAWTIAVAAVALRPDRFGFTDAGSLSREPMFFTLVERSAPSELVRRYARRRRRVVIGMYIGSFAIAAALLVVVILTTPS
jgi:hypothetical protein